MQVKVFIKRNEQEFGPYPLSAISHYINRGSLLPHDLARTDVGSSEWRSLSQLLKEQGIDNPLESDAYSPGKILQDIRSFDLRLLFPWQEIRAGGWLQDRKILLFLCVGMVPIVFVAASFMVNLSMKAIFWAIALYFSCLWALFFYALFRTREVEPKKAVLSFFFTGLISIFVLLTIQMFPPWTFLYKMANAEFFGTRFIGMFLGVGIHEELCKAAVVFWIATRPGRVLLPQTVVFYGMISGLGFGIYEGVHYQLNINDKAPAEIDYILNVLRLTSLPFLHAVWAGISAYFISFAMVVPRKKISLWLIAILIPAAFHAAYNTFNLNFLGGIIGVGTALISVFFLMSYLSHCEELKLNLLQESKPD